MCGSMADIESATAEIRRGKKKNEDEEEKHISATLRALVFRIYLEVDFS